jgi:tetratricopeptide (TPR) repeat protein
VIAEQGSLDAALALARRNCELTERLGDVFSRTLALYSLCYVRLLGGNHAEALDAIERAERLYREAMGGGGEVQAARAALRAEALLGLGRAEEALEVAEGSAEMARANGLRWPLTRVLVALGRARIAAGRDDAVEALDEAARIAGESGATVTLETIEEVRETIAAAR